MTLLLQGETRLTACPTSISFKVTYGEQESPSTLVMFMAKYTIGAAHLRYARNGVSLHPCVATLLAM